MPYGTYDCMGFGAVRSWTHIAKTIFDLTNGNGDKAIPVSIAEYYSGAKGPAVPRPAHSMRKLDSTGFDPPRITPTLSPVSLLETVPGRTP